MAMGAERASIVLRIDLHTTTSNFLTMMPPMTRKIPRRSEDLKIHNSTIPHTGDDETTDDALICTAVR